MASTVKVSKHWVHWFFSAIMFFIIAILLTFQYANLYMGEYVTLSEPWIDTFDTRLMLAGVGIALLMTIISLNYALPLDVMNENMKLHRQVNGLIRVVKRYRDDPIAAHDGELAARALGKTGDIILPFPERERKDA